MGGSKKQTIGYHYMFDILFGLCRGPINDFRTIMVADKIAWEGPLCNGDVQAIQKPNLFGGEKKEGGVQGPFRVFFGAEDQVLPGSGSANCGSSGPKKGTQTLPAVKTAIGGRVSEFRGTTMLWFSGLVSSMNPYPKEWSFRVRRYSAGWHGGTAWYVAKAVIFMGAGKIHAMNPAHIIYECLTNPLWGRGLPASYIDENSFVYAANTLCNEGFGLCFAWQRTEEIDQFIELVQKHIGSVLYADPETGKMTLRLIRNDYVAADLPTFTPTTGLLDITEDDASSQDEIFSEIIGTGRDPIKNEDFQVRVHNLAARQSQDGPNTNKVDYTGIPTRDLMARVLQRDLQVHASGLKKLSVVLDRAGWQIRPGMCFRVSDTRRGIANMVLRAGEITDQSFRDGKITIKAVQDVYGLPATSYVTPVETTWTPPATIALPAVAERLVEANYRDIYIQVGEAQAGTLDATEAYAGTVAVSPNSVMYEYALAIRAQGEAAFDASEIGPFTGAATLVDAITPLQTSVAITGAVNFTSDVVGQVILVDNEQMGVTAFDTVTGVLTVKRGVADTVPAAHAAAASVWAQEEDFVASTRSFAAGEIVEAKVLTRTSSDELPEASAALLSLAMTGRQARPYPPANVTVEGFSIFATLPPEIPEPDIVWVHRDRVLQGDQIVGHAEASIGPEAGTTYTIRVYNSDFPTVVIRTVAGIAGTTWVYDLASQAADGSPASVWIELESVRDGLASHQRYRFFVALQAGYGLGYGMNYGGA